MPTLNLAIFEGPAGSGKTTLMDRLLLRNTDLVIGGAPLPDFERPRSYEGEGGRALSQLKDTKSVISAVYAPRDGRAVAIDRGYISQAVYGAIRHQRQKPPDEATEMPILNRSVVGWQVLCMTATVLAAMSEHRSRAACAGVEVPHDPGLNVLFLVTLPTLDALRHTRGIAAIASAARNGKVHGRTYPYPPEMEISAYMQVLRAFESGDVHNQLNLIYGGMDDVVLTIAAAVIDETSLDNRIVQAETLLKTWLGKINSIELPKEVRNAAV